MTERAGESRRDFLKKLPRRTVGTLGVVGAGSFLLSGCAEGSGDAPREPQNRSEELVNNTIAAYNQAETHPSMFYTAAVVAAQSTIEGRDQQEFNNKYDRIVEPYRNWFTDYGIAGNLAYGATRFGYEPDAVITLYDTARSNFVLDSATPGDIATLAMAGDGNVEKPASVFRQIAGNDALQVFGIVSSYDSVITLTSAGLKQGVDKTIEDFNAIKGSQTFWNNRTPAILTLAASIGADTQDVLDTYAQVNDHDFASFLGIRHISETSIAALTLASTLGIHTAEDVLKMYDFASRFGNLDSNTATRLTLATAAKDAPRPVISRDATYTVGKAVHHTIVPISF